jgi:LacI family transcriptional regulator
MADDDLPKRATVHDVARAAGVSLATVDRVLNGRPGVRPETAERVAAAIGTLDFRRDLSASLLARSRDLTVTFLIPRGHNAFMERLADAVRRQGRGLARARVRLDVVDVPPFDGRALADALDALQPRDCDCAVVVAPDDRWAHAGIERTSRRGVAVVTLVSDVPGSARRAFVGIDNVAAGRTAASLLGRFCHEGAIGLIAGSQALQDHAERIAGFREVLAAEFPTIAIAGPLEGRDDDRLTGDRLAELLDRYPRLAGLYSVGAGTAGLVAGLAVLPDARRPRVVVHELTDASRGGLRTGLVDVVLDQHPDREVAAAIGVARALAGDPNARIRPEPIELGVYLRDNLAGAESAGGERE